MTDPDTDLNDLFEAMPQVSRVTAESLAVVLQDFPLALVSPFDMARLAEVIRPAIYIALISEKLDSAAGSAAVGKKLASLANRAGRLWGELIEIGNDANEAIELFLWKQGDPDRERVTVPLSQHHFGAFHKAVASLAQLADLLSAVSKNLSHLRQAPKWKSSVLRDWRIDLAVLLTPVFESAFGRKASLINRHYANANPPPNYWSDFYQRMLELAFDEKTTPDLAGVLSEARKRVLQRRKTFSSKNSRE